MENLELPGQEGCGALHALFPGIVIYSQATAEQLADLESRKRSFPTPLPRSESNRALLEGWAEFLAPHFGNGHACNLTGTYSDSYGYAHGLMLVRNVVKDFQRFRRSIHRESEPANIGVEYHPTTNRAILHLMPLKRPSYLDLGARGPSSPTPYFFNPVRSLPP